MANDRPFAPTFRPEVRVSADAGPGLTRAEFNELATELQELRTTHQAEFADRLRDARDYGSPGDNEDVLAVHEEVSVSVARIARLEKLLRSAPIVDREFDGCVSLGCAVRVADNGGRISEYVLIGRRGESSARTRCRGNRRSDGRSSAPAPASSCAWSSPTDATGRYGSFT